MSGEAPEVVTCNRCGAGDLLAVAPRHRCDDSTRERYQRAQEDKGQQVVEKLVRELLRDVGQSGAPHMVLAEPGVLELLTLAQWIRQNR